MATEVTDVKGSEEMKCASVDVEEPKKEALPQEAEIPVATAFPVVAETVQPKVQPKVPRRVHFLPEVSVVLIPCLNEYKEAKLFDSLWWTPIDMRSFQVNLCHALQVYMLKNNFSDRKQAFKKLIAEDCESERRLENTLLSAF